MLNWVPIRQFMFNVPHGRTLHTVAILKGRIFILLVRGYVWLENRARMFWSRWDLENDEYLKIDIHI